MSTHVLPPERVHYKWNKNLPPALEVDPGDIVTCRTRDVTDGQVTPGCDASVLASINFDRIYPLAGPISVRGAATGDALEVERVAMGTWDLALDLGLVAIDDPDDCELIWQLRGLTVIKSRRLGLRPPIDGIYARFQHDQGLRQVCQRSLHMGFGGELLIHPRQIPVARSVFSPDPAALALANEVVTAYEEAVLHGRGVVEGYGCRRPLFPRSPSAIRLICSRFGRCTFLNFNKIDIEGMRAAIAKSDRPRGRVRAERATSADFLSQQFAQYCTKDARIDRRLNEMCRPAPEAHCVDVVERGAKLHGAVAALVAAQDFPGLHHERRRQGRRAVPHAIAGPSIDPPRPHRPQ